MNEVIINATKNPCPKPVMMTKAALKNLKFGEKLVILTDNEIASDNVYRFLLSNGTKPEKSFSDGVYKVSAEHTTEPATECPTCVPMNFQKESSVWLVTSSVMGQGSDELGKLLMHACFNSIHSLDLKPAKVIFYNSGVTLACEGSPILEALHELEKTGVTVYVCGTCLDYFDLKDKLKAGIISNMYDIMDCLTKSSQIIKI